MGVSLTPPLSPKGFLGNREQEHLFLGNMETPGKIVGIKWTPIYFQLLLSWTEGKRRKQIWETMTNIFGDQGNSEKDFGIEGTWA